MNNHDKQPWARNKILVTLGLLGALTAACGDDTDGEGGNGADGGGGNPADDGGGGNPPIGGGGNPTTGGGGEGGGGGPQAEYCNDQQPGSTRSSPIAISADDSVMVVANRDAGSVTVFSITYNAGTPTLEKTDEIATGDGSEPWAVVIDGCSDRAYVALRNRNQVIRIDNLKNAPEIGETTDVGAEPTGLAISPMNTRVYSANWVEGTVSVLDGASLEVVDTVDLNATLVDTAASLGDALGNIEARPALAHPRAIAMTHDTDGDDGNETLYVTEWYALRTGPDSLGGGPLGGNADESRSGIVYSIDASNNEASAIVIPPVTDTGFNAPVANALGTGSKTTGCFPNQIGAIAVDGDRVYVTSTCASPEGPLGVFTGPTGAASCTSLNAGTACGTAAGVPSACTAGVCQPNPHNVKTSTHPVLTVIDGANVENHMLDGLFVAPAVASARVPLLPTDVAIKDGLVLVSAQGTDAVFVLNQDAGTDVSVNTDVADSDFINVKTGADIRGPVGVATIHGNDAIAFTSNDGTWDVSAINVNTRLVFDGIEEASAVVPTTGEAREIVRGKRFFNTGLGRWSFQGQGWGSCAACHIDGLTDNVTWYFGRGPRQSTSLDGSFATDDPTDQRIFNWTAIFDEIADFEGNTRGTSGGVGAIVNINNEPPQNGDRNTTVAFGLVAGSAQAAADAGVLSDWAEIVEYMQEIRSPRAPVGLVQADVDAGRALFTSVSSGNCVACHSGPKWTYSTVFYEPNAAGNAAVGSANWKTGGGGINNFPVSMLPVDQATFDAGTNTTMIFAGAGGEQAQCALRPVGTFTTNSTTGVGPAAVGLAEIRQDMTTLAQGGGAAGRGFNVPSLLGQQTGAPYFHGGNARTLEELFDGEFFADHHGSDFASGFQPDADQTRQLVAFILSIDEETTTVDIPVKGPNGGDLCFAP